MEALIPPAGAVSRRKPCRLCDRISRANGLCRVHQPVDKELAALRARIRRARLILAGGARNQAERRQLQQFIDQCEARQRVLSGRHDD